MAAPNPSAQVRRFQKNGAVIGNAQLEQPYDVDTQLQGILLLPTFNLSRSFGNGICWVRIIASNMFLICSND
jgi:hypothetical protein